MDMMERNQGMRAAAKRTDRFIFVETYSGRGLLSRDQEGGRHLLSVAATDEEIGFAVEDALSRSRFLSASEAKAFLDRDRVKRGYEAWVAEMIERFAFKSRRDLFKDMISCDIKLIDQEVSIRPTSHQKLESWEALDDQMTVKAGGASAAEIGAALRLAFDRCDS